jgi:RNA polymerase sigma-70 factor (ECF subfamily)
LLFSWTETEKVVEQNCDRDLINAFRRGSHKAFEILYTRYKRRLYVYAYSLLKSESEAEEAMQDVFMKLISNTEAFVETDDISPLLFTVCRNYCFNLVKRRNLAKKQSDDPRFQILEEDSPLKTVAEREEAQILNEIIGSLPAEQREVLVMKVYGGLTFKQIAQTVGEPQGTVATRYRSAIEKVKLALQAQGGGTWMRIEK